MLEDSTQDLTISAVACQARIQPSALRYYEKVGILPKPRRVNGRRRYEPDILQRLTLIRIAQQAGFTIAEIRTLFENVAVGKVASDQWQVLAQQKLVEVDAIIAHAQDMKCLLERVLNCNCSDLDECAKTLVQTQKR